MDLAVSVTNSNEPYDIGLVLEMSMKQSFLKSMNRYGNTDLYVYICMHIIPLLCLLRGPGSTLSVQIVVSKYHSPLKEAKYSWRNG